MYPLEQELLFVIGNGGSAASRGVNGWKLVPVVVSEDAALRVLTSKRQEFGARLVLSAKDLVMVTPGGRLLERKWG